MLLFQMPTGKKSGYTRGSNTLFRVVYDTHLNLSQMADRKAHLMLGINTFLLSFVITKKKMGVLSHAKGMLIPDVMLVVFCLTCIVLAIQASRPRMPDKRPDPKSPGFNWIFFGHFAYAELKQFQEKIDQLTGNPGLLHAAMVNDLYWMGKSLQRKYYNLYLCYLVFSIGLPIVLAVFVYFWLK